LGKHDEFLNRLRGEHDVSPVDEDEIDYGETDRDVIIQKLRARHERKRNEITADAIMQYGIAHDCHCYADLTMGNIYQIPGCQVELFEAMAERVEKLTMLERKLQTVLQDPESVFNRDDLANALESNGD
jgi:hypothetical protein